MTDLLTYEATIHFGAIPVDPSDWEPIDPADLCIPHRYTYDGDSFVEWGEPLEDDRIGHPLHIETTVLIELPTAWEVDRGRPARSTLWDAVDARRELLATCLPDGWRLLDYAVVTDALDHSVNAETIGRWGA